MKLIERIVISTMKNESPGLSWLGEFNDDPGPLAVPTNFGPRGFKYFHSTVAQNYADAERDFRIMLKYRKGELSELGMQAIAIITCVPNGEVSSTEQVLTSGIAWGLRSDDPENQKLMLMDRQVALLKQVLAEFGFTQEEIRTAPAYEER